MSSHLHAFSEKSRLVIHRPSLFELWPAGSFTHISLPARLSPPHSSHFLLILLPFLR
jgi:demethoxyubiquinone hydroxylase (CLK1/Coq7/Cat5 family)